MDLEELQEIVAICVDEIVKLKQEKEELEAIVKELLSGEKNVIERVGQVCIDLEKQRKLINQSVNNVKYELADDRCDKENMYYPKFYKEEETLRLIIDEKKSMARFGDGEFALMSREERQKFQHLDDRLSERLIEIIRSDEEGMLIAIADNYGSLDKFNSNGKQGIRTYMTEEVRKQHKQFLDLNRTYHNAYISRPYVLYADNHTDAPRKRFDSLKQIWDKRNVIFVEGLLTRLGVGNDLFDNAAQIRRIEVPATNSYDKYDEIIQAALKYAEPDSLFLIAMGPAAGVLAYDLQHAGYQALDIGHVDLEYEWFLRGTGERCEVKNKYNNEYQGGDNVEDIQDEEYFKQIICKVL